MTPAADGSMCASVTSASGGAPGAGLAAREIWLAALQAKNQRRATIIAPMSHAASNSSSKTEFATGLEVADPASTLVGDTIGAAALNTKKSGWTSTGGGSPARAPTVYSAENGTRNFSDASSHIQ